MRGKGDINRLFSKKKHDKFVSVAVVFVAIVYAMIVVVLLMGGMQILSEYAHPIGQTIRRLTSDVHGAIEE